MQRAILTLRCSHCHRREELSLTDLLNRLRELGFLRRGGEPSVELVLEVAQAAIAEGRWGNCPECGHSGWGASESTDDAEDDPALWGDARHCEQCHAVIPPERLEIFPQATRCAKCEQQGSDADEREFCPHCGSVMQLKAAGSRYRMYCGACRKSF
jgi:RNA polymerase-binding transcription factor DksA